MSLLRLALSGNNSETQTSRTSDKDESVRRI